MITPGQLILLAKIGAVAALILGLYGIGHHNGEKAVQARWDGDKAVRAASQAKLVEDHAKEIERLREEQDTTNRRVSTDHEDALQKLGKKYDRDVAAVAARGGLRISSSICAAATTTETASNSGHHEDTAGTVQLPDDITNNLFSEAKRADEIVEQARACQAWVHENGFYGDALRVK